jgi:outer membrane protein assembly factor BamB
VIGSPTVEFNPQAKPADTVEQRPPQVVRKQPWPLYGYDPARTHEAPFKLRPPFRVVWAYRLGNIVEFPPVIAYGRMFVAQDRGRFFVINAETGKKIWRKRFHNCSAASPAVGDLVVYMAYMQPFPCRRQPRTQQGFIVALRVRGGKQLWRYRTGAIESSPLLVNKVLYFGSWDHHLYALDVRRKKPRLKWKVELDAEVNSSPAYSSGTVFVGTDGGSVYAVNARTGKVRWRSQSFSRFGRREYFYATPTVAYGRVFVGNTDGTMYAFGASSGRLVWAQPAGSYVYTAAAVWRRTVYVGSYDGNIYAFDAATGRLRWKHSAPSSIHGAPTVLNGVLYFSTCGTCGERGSRYAKLGSRGTYALDARNGRLLWTFFDGKYSPVVADRERIYLAGRTRVYGLVPKR